MKSKGTVIVLLTVLFCAPHATYAASDMDISPGVGWSVDVGTEISGSPEAVLSTTATFVLLNASLDYNMAISGEHGDEFRGYIGAGLGPMIQIQLGLGESGSSGRIRTSMSLNKLFGYKQTMKSHRYSMCCVRILDHGRSVLPLV